MSFPSISAVKDVSSNTRVTCSNVGIFPTLMGIFSDILTFWNCLFCSQICISTGLALWHLLPHALSYGADIWFGGQLTKSRLCKVLLFHFFLTTKCPEGWAVMFCIGVEWFTLSALCFCCIDSFLSRWSSLTPALLGRHHSLKPGCRQACPRRARL